MKKCKEPSIGASSLGCNGKRRENLVNSVECHSEKGDRGYQFPGELNSVDSA